MVAAESGRLTCPLRGLLWEQCCGFYLGALSTFADCGRFPAHQDCDPANAAASGQGIPADRAATQDPTLITPMQWDLRPAGSSPSWRAPYLIVLAQNKFLIISAYLLGTRGVPIEGC
jgi:hypothetical protein